VRISGFSFARNADLLGYPLREALASVLPIVDELVVVVGRGSERDDTRGIVEGLGDPRVRVIDALWDESRGPGVYADLTNLALDACTGDWCLYVQADEVLHEEDHDPLLARCEALVDDPRVEGLLFDYMHFFGDYRHVQRGQGWYPREIRVIRNGCGIRSVRDAQSFRYPDQRRITVARSAARIFHYGWVRHPRLMQTKVEEFWSHRIGRTRARRRSGDSQEFDYGPLGRLATWEGTHPRVMADRIAAFDWADRLRDEDPRGRVRRRLHRDERFVYRWLTRMSHITGIDFNHTNHGRILDV